MDLVEDPKTGNADTAIARLRDHLAAGLIGHDHLIERLLIGLLTGGHILIEGAPGLAKTRSVRRLAEATLDELVPLRLHRGRDRIGPGA